MDHATKEKDKLIFARVVIEVGLQHKLPDTIKLCHEIGVIMEQKVESEWKPVQKCDRCKGFGHEKKQCRRNIRRKVWVQKKKHITNDKGF